MKLTPHSQQALLDRLTAGLEAKGVLHTDPWRKAFAQVPRHLFAPEIMEQETNEHGIAVWRPVTDQARYIAAIYSDHTQVTALDPATAQPTDDGAWTGMPISSTTMPSLMAGMLEDLGLVDGDRVLEIGTGTGYNAALLSARLGDRNVTSIDISPDLIHLAQQRLTDAGYKPHLAVGDGRNGDPAGAPYDALISTCSVDHIPAAWLQQVQPRGVIVTDLAAGIEGGLVRLVVDDDGHATGAFTAHTGRFMPARSDIASYEPTARPAYGPTVGSRDTEIGAAEYRAHYPFRLALGIALPTVEMTYHSHDGTTSIQLQDAAGSWARVPLGRPGHVTYGGPTDLWKYVEQHWRWWNNADRPDQTHITVTATPDGTRAAWAL